MVRLARPARTPAHIVRKVNADTTSALNSADLGAALRSKVRSQAVGHLGIWRFMQAEMVSGVR